MGNQFDKIAAKVFNATTKLMGYEARWTPEGLEEVKAMVHLKSPTDDVIMANKNYHPENMLMEYKLGDLVGLKESADNGRTELITLVIDNESVQYDAMNVTAKYDGRIFIAELQINN